MIALSSKENGNPTGHALSVTKKVPDTFSSSHHLFFITFSSSKFPNDNSLVNSPQGVRTDRSFGMKMLHVDEQSGKFQEMDNGDIPYETAMLAEGPMLGPPDSIFTADMDGDGTLDRIEYRVPDQIKIRPANKKVYFDEFEITTTSSVLVDFQRHLDRKYLKVANENAEFRMVIGALAVRRYLPAGGSFIVNRPRSSRVLFFSPFTNTDRPLPFL